VSDRLAQLNGAGQVVFLRCDLNVPLAREGDTVVIGDDGRIRASVATIEALRARGARIVVVAHLGRPRGAEDPDLSLAPVAKRLGQLLGTSVAFIPAVSGQPRGR
jgi:phosphoglycerate kinase